MSSVVSSNGWVGLVARVVLLFLFLQIYQSRLSKFMALAILPSHCSAACCMHWFCWCPSCQVLCQSPPWRITEAASWRSPFFRGSCTTFFFAEPPFSNAIFFHLQITATRFVQLDFLVGLLVVHLLDIEPGIVPLQGTAQNYILCHSVKRTALFSNDWMLWETARTWPQCFWCWHHVGELVQAR